MTGGRRGLGRWEPLHRQAGSPSLRRRELPDERRSVGPGPERRGDLFDLDLSLPAGRLEHAPVVVGSQVRRQQPHSREAERAALEHLEDHGKAPCRTGDRDAVVGLLLGEAEDVPAVREERAVAGAQVHVAGVELREVRDQEHRDASLAPRGPGRERRARRRRAPKGSEKVGCMPFVSRVAAGSGPKLARTSGWHCRPSGRCPPESPPAAV